MTIPSTIRFPDGAGALDGIGRLVRRICLLRARGEAVDSHENALLQAVSDYRAAQGDAAGTLSDSELQAMFGREERRVADALVLCELLVPELVKVMPAPARAAPSPRAEARGVPAVPSSPDRGAPAISDLLDAMLAAERNGRRPSAALQPES